jgi:membrane peptidoglycan carboxypeptidase
MALGIDALTVEEQATMLSTIADNGEYHAAHLVKYWQASGSDAVKQQPKVDQHMVLTPQQAQDEQYAMERTTIDGTAAGNVTYGEQTLGTVIGKTGTTTGSKEGFFIGATTQYSLVVGMFTPSTSDPHSLEALGGGGFGGYWPAKIWNSMAEADFSSTPQTFPTNPSGEGTAWDMLGKVPQAKPVCSKNVHGHKVNTNAKGCPKPNPTPTQNCGFDQNGNWTCNGNNGANPTSTCDPNNDPNCQATATSTCDPNNNPNCQTTPSPTVTCDPNSDPNCQTNPDGTVTCDPNSDPNCTTVSTNGVSSSVPAVQATTALGGLVLPGTLVLPGSLLLSKVSRRRKRKHRDRKAE